jgi:hypothetical protein
MGARIISGDRPLLDASSQAVHAYGVPWDGKEQLYLQEDAPVKAIIEVRQSHQNALRKLNHEQAFRLLMSTVLHPHVG